MCFKNFHLIIGLARVTAMPFGANTDAIEFQHSDGGKYKVPDDFVFPSVDILCGWKYWWTGFSSKALPKKKTAANTMAGRAIT